MGFVHPNQLFDPSPSQNLQFVQPNCNSTLPHGKHTKHRHLLFPNMQLTFQLRQFDAKCTRLLWSFKWRHGWSISWMGNMVPNQKWWVQKNPPRTYDHVIILGKNSDTRRFADFISMEWETVRKSMMVWLMDEITSQMGTLPNHVSVLLHPTCCFSVAFWYYQLVVTVCDFNHNLPLPDLLETSTSLETFIFWEAKSTRGTNGRRWPAICSPTYIFPEFGRKFPGTSSLDRPWFLTFFTLWIERL